MKYESDIVLGERYIDPQTGIRGTATSLCFFQHACERAVLEFVNADGVLQENAFDSPRLVSETTPSR